MPFSCNAFLHLTVLYCNIRSTILTLMSIMCVLTAISSLRNADSKHLRAS